MKNNKFLFILVGVYLLYCFLLAVLAPIFIKPMIAVQAKHHINGAVSVEGLSINPFTHTLSLKGLVLLNNKKNKLVKFDRLSVNIDLLSFIFSNADIYQLELIGLDVFTGEGEKNPWLELPQLSIGDTSIDLTQKNIYIKNIIAKQLKLSVVLMNTQASNIQQFTKQIEQLLITKNAEKSPPWLVHITRLRIHAANLSVLDKTIQNEDYPDGITTVIKPINLELASIKSDLSQDIKLNLEAELFKGKLNIEGSINPATLASQINYSIKDVQLSALNAYVEHFSLASIISGSFSTQGQVESLRISQTENAPVTVTTTNDTSTTDKSSNFNTENISSEKTLQIKLANSSQVKMLAVKHQNFDIPFLICENIETNNLNYVLLPSTLTLDNLSIKLCTVNPYISNDSTTNFAFSKEIEAEQQKSEDADNAKILQPASHSINIKLIELINNSILIEDFSQGKKVTLHLTDLQAKLENLAEGKTDLSTYQLNALLNNHAPLSIQGNGNFLNPKLSAKGNITLKNIGLKEFSPYALKLSSRPIKKGALAMNIDISVLENNLNSYASLNLLGIELGKKEDIKAASKLPIGLALGILKDSKGDVHIGLPVKGSLDDPTFSISKQVIKILTGTISKAARAPMSIISDLITGGDNTETLKIIFTGQVVSIDDAQQKIISKVANVLKKKPELSLHLSALSWQSSLNSASLNNEPLNLEPLNLEPLNHEPLNHEQLNHDSSNNTLSNNVLTVPVGETRQVELLHARQQAVFNALVAQGVSPFQLNKLPLDKSLAYEDSEVLLEFFAR